jgi:hypothetical protein
VGAAPSRPHVESAEHLWKSRIIASAVVFEGTGLRASMIRSVVIGIAMLSRPKCPHTVFESTTAGSAWLSQHLKASGSPHHSAEAMELAIAQVRQRALVSG